MLIVNTFANLAHENMRHSALFPVSRTPNDTDLRRHFQVRGRARVPMNATQVAYLFQQPLTNNAIRSIRKHF